MVSSGVFCYAWISVVDDTGLREIFLTLQAISLPLLPSVDALVGRLVRGLSYEDIEVLKGIVRLFWDGADYRIRLRQILELMRHGEVDRVMHELSVLSIDQREEFLSRFAVINEEHILNHSQRQSSGDISPVSGNSS